MIRPLSALAALAFGATATAQAFDTYGFNPRAVSMGGTQAAAEGDFTSVFYNPALLLGTDRPSLGLGFSWMKPFTYGAVTSGSQPFGFRAPVDYAGVTFGFEIPLGGKLGHRVALGLGMNVPTSDVYRGTLIDASEPYFYRYDSGPERLQILAALAVRPLDWLSAGAGVQLQSDFSGSSGLVARVEPNGGGKIIERNLTNTISGVVSPTAGIEVTPFDRLHLYASWRGEAKANYQLPINVSLEQVTSQGDVLPLDTLGVAVSGVSYYTPHAFTVGGRFQVTQALRIAADISMELWSRAPPPQVSIDITFSKTGVIGQVLNTTCITSRDVTFPAPDDLPCPPGNEDPVSFQNIFVPRVGAEYALNDQITLRAGYFYRPSVVPPQSGNTNFLDPSVHAISAGGAYTLPDPLELAQNLVIDGAVQLGIMAPQDVTKSGANRLPNYRVGGETLNLVISARYEF